MPARGLMRIVTHLISLERLGGLEDDTVEDVCALAERGHDVTCCTVCRYKASRARGSGRSSRMQVSRCMDRTRSPPPY